MNMLTCCVEVHGVEEVNAEINQKQDEGWFLRGKPDHLGNDWFMLTFEKPDLGDTNDVYDDE